ncbi:MAG: hypothetical protein IJT44_11490 [Clostridia bacterium]|nr:hypothetical protein [Clostridia bacterium]
MTLHDFILEHAEDLLDLPEEPDREEFEICRFVSDPGAWYGYHEETGFDEEAYEEAYRDWELECERIYAEVELSDMSDLYLIVDGETIEDFDEMLAYLERQVEKTEGYNVWIA